MRKLLTVLAALVVLVLIIIGVVRWIGSTPETQPPTTPPEAQPTQPEWCQDFEVIAAPGTWESAPTDDPANPTFNPQSFMLNITRPIQQTYSPDQVKVWTLPYTAQFRSIQDMSQMSYDDSREEGSAAVIDEMVSTNSQCPLTQFILTGFSQGAVILGDIASEIGGGRTSIPPEQVAGVTLIADGRREPGVGVTVGNEVAGVGAEIALHDVNALIQPIVPGATMRGVRAGGFGVLNDRVNQICAPDDAICDAPMNIGSGIDRAMALVEANGVHALYATNPNVIPGTTADQWAVGWINGIISG